MGALKSTKGTPLYAFEMFGYEVYLARTEKEYKTAVENWRGAPNYNHSLAFVAPFTNEKGEQWCLLKLDPSRAKTLASFAGVVAHEATHVAQNLMQFIHETRPGDEFPAYVTQEITSWAFNQCLPILNRVCKGNKK